MNMILIIKTTEVILVITNNSIMKKIEKEIKKKKITNMTKIKNIIEEI